MSNNVDSSITDCTFVLGIYAYAVLTEGRKSTKKDLELELKKMIKKRIGGLALPEIILV